MAKKNKKKITLELPKSSYKTALDRLPRGQAAKVSKEISKQLRQVSKHFKTPGHGWPLDFQLIEDDVLHDLLGFHVGDLLLYAFVSKGYKVKCNDNRFMISK